jgi:hypothetical protein
MHSKVQSCRRGGFLRELQFASSRCYSQAKAEESSWFGDISVFMIFGGGVATSPGDSIDHSTDTGRNKASSPDETISGNIIRPTASTSNNIIITTCVISIDVSLNKRRKNAMTIGHGFVNNVELPIKFCNLQW